MKKNYYYHKVFKNQIARYLYNSTCCLGEEEFVDFLEGRKIHKMMQNI